jgi:dCTP deaminase
LSIWNDRTIIEYCNHSALVAPFDPANVNPASIDLRLGTSYRFQQRESYRWPLAITDTVETWGDEYILPNEGAWLYPGTFILCCTMETVAIPNDACAALFSKSSTGRMGLEHLHAGWIDPGFRGQLTLEFKNVAPWPILLQPGKRYMQMVVHDLVAPAARDYSQTGRYQNQTGATPAREVR